MIPKLNPLQQAVIENNSQLVEELKDSKWRFEKDANGFDALDLSDLLSRDEIQKILMQRKPKTIRAQLKNSEEIKLLTKDEFKNIFNVTYRNFLTFSTYEDLKETIKNCPWFFKFQWLFGKNDEMESSYLEFALQGLKAKTIIKWINPVLEYGLFADTDLPEKAFIGEYTGIIRRIDKKDPDANPYCFHYPSKYFSFKYFVIDALNEGNSLRFINHSDKPNLQPLWLVDKRLLHLVFIANQPIAKGTELTFDYGNDYWMKRNKI